MHEVGAYTYDPYEPQHCECGRTIGAHETRCARCDSSKQGVCVVCYEGQPICQQICRGCYELRLQRRRREANHLKLMLSEADASVHRAECWDDKLEREASRDELVTARDLSLQWVDYYQAVLDGAVHELPPSDLSIATEVLG